MKANAVSVTILLLNMLVLAACQDMVDPNMSTSDLHNKYWTIFNRFGNRNAASHLWATWILDRSENFTEDKIHELFSGFCPISGSPVTPRAGNLYSAIPFLTAEDTSTTHTGNVQVCCWPCVCDLQEFVKSDTLDVMTSEGERTFDVLVIGDPCINPKKIPRRAPEVRCEDGALTGATLSTNGHIVIGMMQKENGPITAMRSAGDMKAWCDWRKSQGYQSGMGTIFVEVASINKIV